MSESIANPPPHAAAGPPRPGLGRLLWLAERALNRQIAQSTAARDLLASLQGRTFTVLVRGTNLRCTLRAEQDRLVLDAEASAGTATLRAAPLDLLKLMGATGLAGLKGTHADLTGDLSVAERYADLLKLTRPDLEEDLAGWIGDIPAHALGQAAQGAAAWLRRAARTVTRDTAEYLQEERRLLPAPLEVQAFYAEVDRLRDDVDRAAARLVRLERR